MVYFITSNIINKDGSLYIRRGEDYFIVNDS